MTGKPHNGRTRVTLRDIAGLTGVTPAAVSMALSGSGRISEDTRLAIQKAANDLGYVPSSAARALRNQHAGAIALIVPTTATHVFGHSYFMHVLSGVSTVANARDTQLLISTNPDQEHGLAAYERVMRSNSADGAILTSAAISDLTVERLTSSGMPVVLIGNFPYLSDAITVGIDDVGASRAITEHLIERHGRTRLLHVAGPLDHQTGIDRRDGFLSAMESHGLKDQAVVIEGDLSEISGREIVADLGEGIADFDGIVFANDDMAFGAMQLLKERGIAIPTDIAIVGFDDFGLARAVSPSLSTVHVPAEEIARLATERLFEIIDGTRSGWSRLQVDVQLALRESCGCEQ